MLFVIYYSLKTIYTMKQNLLHQLNKAAPYIIIVQFFIFIISAKHLIEYKYAYLTLISLEALFIMYMLWKMAVISSLEMYYSHIRDYYISRNMPDPKTKQILLDVKIEPTLSNILSNKIHLSDYMEDKLLLFDLELEDDMRKI